MNKRTQRGMLFGAVALTSLAIYECVNWYTAPAHIEDMDSMIYCSCGYSKVRFGDGKIMMVKYLHDDVKPGDLIGTYSTSNRDVELKIYFGGEVFITRCRIDHVGLLASPGGRWEYQATDSQSVKTWIHYAIRRLF